MTDRAASITAFLSGCGWGNAARSFLAGDASARRYERLTLDGKSAVLMDAPPEEGEDTESFVRIADHLLSIGLSAPRILAQDIASGLLLIEDLGDGIYARLIERRPELEEPLYKAAVEVLAQIERNDPPPALSNLTAADWAGAAAFALDWYRFAITGDRMDTSPFRKVLTETLQHHADAPRVMILRDYHAENLLWLPDRRGVARVGVLDFQLAQLGQPGYDLVSLLQDARRDTGQGIEQTMIRYYLSLTGRAEGGFGPAYAALGAQRALRILGIFARLSLVGGKPGYVDKIPRVWSQLQRNLEQPELAALAAICRETLPAPTPERLERIRAKCGHHAP
ncbi:phosphotransferase [Tabrizicola sp. J26]|uniref:aminoglycoside phosphotransferase family protein n=1 Tax=Alitabrizicola rongguiensis TaxID=2909234 RepID=UPI001F42E2FF|nr:phosphotransferase [Tabrizicola rongguiensis]MCF1708230.1 phosphotransferase [Tabrizicola rongguiensis]